MKLFNHAVNKLQIAITNRNNLKGYIHSESIDTWNKTTNGFEDCMQDIQNIWNETQDESKLFEKILRNSSLRINNKSIQDLDPVDNGYRLATILFVDARTEIL